MEQLPKDTLIHITGLTVYELYKGVSYIGSKKLENDLEKFIRSVEVLQLDSYIEKEAGKIYASLKKKGENQYCFINDDSIYHHKHAGKLKYFRVYQSLS